MKTFIKVTESFNARHFYMDATDRVKFLRELHNHTFFVTTQIETKGLNRELEFYLVKEYLKDFLLGYEGAEFSFSCEMIAKQVYEHLVKKYGSERDYIISISEDNVVSSVTEWRND